MCLEIDRVENVTQFDVHFFVGEDTIGDPNGDEDEPAIASIKLEGDWKCAIEQSKYGLRLFLIRSIPEEDRDQNWVGWYRS